MQVSTVTNAASNALQELVRERLERQGWSYGDVARRGGIPRSTVHHLATTDRLVRMPQPATLEGLARGLELPSTPYAARPPRPAGSTSTRRPPTPRSDVLIASLQQLSAQDRRHVAALVESLLERGGRQPDTADGAAGPPVPPTARAKPDRPRPRPRPRSGRLRMSESAGGWRCGGATHSSPEFAQAPAKRSRRALTSQKPKRGLEPRPRFWRNASRSHVLVVQGGPTTAVVRGQKGESVVLLSGELPAELTDENLAAVLDLAAAVLDAAEMRLFRRCLDRLRAGDTTPHPPRRDRRRRSHRLLPPRIRTPALRRPRPRPRPPKWRRARLHEVGFPMEPGPARCCVGCVEISRRRSRH